MGWLYNGINEVEELDIMMMLFDQKEAVSFGRKASQNGKVWLCCSTITECRP
ncbi:MAG: hypothetical protein GX256_08270 [Fretibacterium sp.]|nr:hypothetical protein [Fretibacterium sp.]